MKDKEKVMAARGAHGKFNTYMADIGHGRLRPEVSVTIRRKVTTEELHLIAYLESFRQGIEPLTKGEQHDS